MRKIREAAVVVAVLGSVGLLGAGTAFAGGGANGGSYSRVQSNQQDSYRQQSSGHRHGRSHGHKTIIRQHTSCRAFDKNVDVLGEVAIANGLLGFHGFHGHKHGRGVQSTRMGLSMGCDNVIRL